MSSFFNKMRHFPEFHETITAIESQKKAEQTMIDGYTKAFGDDFKKYSGQQKPEFQNGLNGIIECGIQETTIIRDSFVAVSNFANDMQPLLQQEIEINKWRELCKQAQELAKKSREDAKKKEAAYNRAQTSGKPSDISKAEVAYSSAKRKAEEDTNSANDQQKSLEEKEGPYREQFLQSFVTPMTAVINLRIQEAEKILQLTNQFDEAISKVQDFHDEGVDHYKERFQQLSAVVVE
ncbi:hypothetical protein GPJ56_002214 [Histomonas meleagridis]|uniref:uncharacterized protein n=1 Tax=Histomonas meleagridis TaxID=135588 RepID=UPI00355A147E|nr:hypothetical protein GPJ56_002214 [Histomonas meleagridis]KAH0796141.1 hypothetical protein GO595_011108 [Histomonas meleagridis]